MSAFVDVAAAFATGAHCAVGQKRKYTGEDYIRHPYEVAKLVKSVTDDEEMIAAAYLHDVVEDTQVTQEQIVAFFGEKVAALVDQLTDKYTDPRLGNRAHRKAMERDRWLCAGPKACTIKLADMIVNTIDIVSFDPGFAKVYLAEKELMLPLLLKGDFRLWKKAEEKLYLGHRALALT